MKRLLFLLAFLLPLAAMGQAVSRTELKATNDLIRAQTVGAYANVAQMIASRNTNAYQNTLGYYTAGDGGAATYYYQRGGNTPTNMGSSFAHPVAGRLRLLHIGKINVHQFGAKGDGAAADRPFIQEAITYACQSSNAVFNVEFVPGKTYLCDWGLNLVNTNASGVFSFLQSLTIGQSAPAYDAPSPRLHFTATNSYGFALQHGRSVTIRGLYLTGPNAIDATLGAYSDKWLDRTNFVRSDLNIRTNGYSPNAAIVIDPFDADIPVADRYGGPATNLYNATGGGGTSHCFIEGNLIYGWYIGIMENPTVNGQQGDDIHKRDNQMFYVCEGVHIGQAQSRSCTWSGGGIAFAYMGFNCLNIGQSVGVMPSVEGSQFSQMTYLMSGSASGWGKNTIRNVHGEELMSLGTVSADGADFNNCIIDFSYAASTPTEQLLFGGPVQFFNCKLTSPIAPIFFKRTTAAIEAAGVTFYGGEIGSSRSVGSALNTHVIVPALNAVQFHDTSMGNGTIRMNKTTDPLYGNINGHPVQMGSLLSKGTNTYFIKNDYASFLRPANSPTYSTNLGIGTFTWNGTEQIGDALLTLDKFYLGVVTAITNGVAVYSCSPKYVGVDRHSAFNFYVDRYPRWHDATTASWSSGSQLITNVSNPTAWSVGSTIRGPGLYESTTITNISGTTFTISVPTSASASGASIFDAIAIPLGDVAPSNSVRVVAGTGGITITPSGSGGVMTYTVNDDDAGGGEVSTAQLIASINAYSNAVRTAFYTTNLTAENAAFNVFTTDRLNVVSNTTEFAGAGITFKAVDLNIGDKWKNTNAPNGNIVADFQNLHKQTNNSFSVTWNGAAAGGTDRYITNTFSSVIGSVPTVFAVDGADTVATFTTPVTNGWSVEMNGVVDFLDGTNHVRIVTGYWKR